MRNIYPVKYYSDEGFVEHKIELGDEDLEEIIREYLERHADFDFDEVEVVNNPKYPKVATLSWRHTPNYTFSAGIGKKPLCPRRPFGYNLLH